MTKVSKCFSNVYKKGTVKFTAIPRDNGQDLFYVEGMLATAWNTLATMYLAYEDGTWQIGYRDIYVNTVEDMECYRGFKYNDADIKRIEEGPAKDTKFRPIDLYIILDGKRTHFDYFFRLVLSGQEFDPEEVEIKGVPCE